MGFRFRKSINLGGGVKLNLGKKSAGISLGTKGARVSVNSKGRVTTTVGIPGTGISYQKSTNLNNKTSNKTNKRTSNIQTHSSTSKAQNTNIPSGTIDFINRELQIARESANLIDTTKKADVFFTRYDLLVEKLKALKYFEQDIDFTPNKPSDNLRQVLNEKSEATDRFIYRSYEEYLDKINNLKTDKAKINNIEKFYSSIKEYSKKMDSQNLNTLERLYSKLNESVSKVEDKNKVKKNTNVIDNDFNRESKYFSSLNLGEFWDDLSLHERKTVFFYYENRKIDPINILEAITKYNEYDYLELVKILTNMNNQNEFNIGKKIIDYIDSKKIKPRGKIDLHNYYSSLIEFYYSKQNTQYRNVDKVKELCYFDLGIVLNSIDKIREAEKLRTLNIHSFSRIISILEEEENYEEATRVCRDAIRLGLVDLDGKNFEVKLDNRINS